jgi:NACHT domain
MVWSAGVSAAAAGLAALFAGRTLLDHIFFWVFAVIGFAAFLILLGTARTAIHRRPWLSAAATDTETYAPSKSAAGQELAVVSAARKLAATRAKQIGLIDQMPVRWEVTDRARRAMPNELSRSDFAGDFRQPGSAFEQMPQKRMVVLGEPGAGKTTLVSKLFADLLTEKGQLGIPVSVPAAKWGGVKDIAGHIAGQLAMTSAHVSDALDDGKIFPVVEDFDELPSVLRAPTIKAINKLQEKIPLIVTSRPEAYLTAVKTLEPIRNAAVVELCPLETSDIGTYLKVNVSVEDVSRWEDLSEFLRGPDGGPLATVLANPLMLWLARENYRRTGIPSGELAHSSRFGNQETIEGYLLDEFIPMKFSGDDARQNGTPRQKGRHAQRWLAFLAADLDKTGSREIAWWRLPPMAPWGRPATFALRGAILTAAAWCAAVWALHRLGGWRHVIEPTQLLRGPLGRKIVSFSPQLYRSLAENHDLHATIDAIVRSIPHPLLLLELCAILVAISSGTVQAIFEVRRPGGATGYHICRTKVRWPNIFPAAAEALIMTAVAAILLFTITAGLLPKNHASKLFTSLIHGRPTGLLLLAIFLWALTLAIDPLTTEQLVMSRLPSPSTALRLQRRHTLLILLSQRTLRLIVWWLIFGPVIALAYGAYETIAVLCRITLGGRQSASDTFDDARLWLACTRRMPWRVMKFLMEAERLEILRQIGGVYQFHHIRLQQRLSSQRVQLSPPLTAAAVPCINWWRRQLHRARPRGGWRPHSAALWTLPIWTLRFEERAQAARTSPMGPALGHPTERYAYHEGPGAVQDFSGIGGGHPWVMCALPGTVPSFVAGPVWQALRSVGAEVVQDTGRERPASALTSVGFPVDQIITPDATCVNLTGGSLGSGRLLRNDIRSDWHWEPRKQTILPSAGSSHVPSPRRSSPARLLLNAHADMHWSVPRLEIEDQRYQALAGILTDSELARTIARLTASPHQLEWRERALDRRDRSLQAVVSGPDKDPAQAANVTVRLYNRRRTTIVDTTALLRIGDLPGWLAARGNHTGKDPRLSLDELVTYMSVAWYTVVEVLPSLVVDDPIAVAPVLPSSITMSLSVHQNDKASHRYDIRELIDFSPFELRDNRELTQMIVAVYGPLYLTHDGRTKQTQQALMSLIQDSGYDPITKN